MKLSQPESLLMSSDKYDRQQFSLGDASVILMLLTKQYNNPIRTLTQEYISNGRDANREVNAKRQMEITLPTELRPMLEVRDFGPGITPDRMENVFIKIAASTKRGTDTQTGGFGIGAKSAWAYTDKFNIITHIDGIRRSYVAHYTSNPANPTMKEAFLDQLEADGKTEEPTDQQNGTLIQIPVQPQDIRKFKDAVFRTVVFWDKAEQPKILESGDGISYEEVEVSRPKILREVGRLIVYESIPGHIAREDGQSLVIVDGIPYSIPKKWYDDYYHSYDDKDRPQFISLKRFINTAFSLRFNTGELFIPPTREGVADTEENKNRLESECGDIIDGLYTQIKNSAAKLKTGPEVLEFAQEIGSNYNNAGSTLELKVEVGIYKISFSNYRTQVYFTTKTQSFRTYQVDTSLAAQPLKLDYSSTIRKGDQCLVIDDDCDFSERTLKIRLKYYMLKNDVKRIIVLEKREYKTTEGLVDKNGKVVVDKATGLQAHKQTISYTPQVILDTLAKDYEVIHADELEKPPKDASATSKVYNTRKVEKGKVLLHINSSYGDNIVCETKEVELGDGCKVIFYQPLSDRYPHTKIEMRDLSRIQKSMKLDCHFGFLPDKWLEKNAKKYPNLIPYKEFKSHKFYKEARDLLVFERVYSNWKGLKKSGEFAYDIKLKDEHIKLLNSAPLRIGLLALKDFKVLVSKWQSIRVMDNLKIKDEDPEVQKQIKVLKELLHEFRNNTNSIIRTSFSDSSVDPDELIDYINYVQKRKKKLAKQGDSNVA